MASKEENAWARSARKAYGMKQGATWDNMARNDAIKLVQKRKVQAVVEANTNDNMSSVYKKKGGKQVG